MVTEEPVRDEVASSNALAAALQEGVDWQCAPRFKFGSARCERVFDVVGSRGLATRSPQEASR